MWKIITNDEYSLYAFIAINTVVSLRVGFIETGLLDIIAGGILVGTSLSVILKNKLLKNRKLFQSKIQYLVCIYFIYTFALGIVGIFFWGNDPEYVIREALIQLPLVSLPLLFHSAFEKNTEKAFNRFLFFIVFILIATVTTNLIAFSKNVAKAYYLYQAGRSSMEITIPTLCLFAFVSLSATVRGWKFYSYIFGSVYSLVAIGLSLFRTIWLTDAVLIPLIVLLMPKRRRKAGWHFIFYLVLIIIAILFLVSTAVPFVGLYLQSMFQRLLYSSAVTTDPSLVNRYIEWRAVWETIIDSPVIGYGYGSTFFDYNWILGYSYKYGFTHNGYLFLVLKSGIVGALLLSVSYIAFILKGIQKSFDDSLSDFSQALCRAGSVFLLGLLFTNITLNALAGRDALMWVGVVWGYILFVENQNKSSSITIP